MTATAGSFQGSNGVRIAADAWGRPGDPVAILLHGGGQTRHSWGAVGPTLAQQAFYVVALDARGHGDSDWANDGAYDDDFMVRDLIRVLAELEVSRPLLVGASLGGVTSLIAAGEYGVDAHGLVLVDIAPRADEVGVERIRRFMADHQDGFARLEDVATAIAKYQPQRGPRSDLSGLQKVVRRRQDGRYHWHWDPRFLDRQFSVVEREKRLEQCARHVNAPVLLAHGAASDVLREDGVKRFLAICPTAEYVRVADAAHMIAGDNNDRFAAALIDFVERRTPSAA